MCNATDDRFLINYGWRSLWFDPKYITKSKINVYVKGPFEKALFVRFSPYIAYGQRDAESSPVQFKNGIPDPWAEFLIYNSILTNKLLPNYELMTKEDVDITRDLRKNYRLYIGQGIPDPWLTHSHSDNLDIFPFIQGTNFENANIKKHIFQLLRGKGYNGNFSEKPCFCCQKKFLFECPDKTHSTVQDLKDKRNILNCPCSDCHGKEPTTAPFCCTQHCNCIPIMQNWMLEHSDFTKCKNCCKKKRVPLDLSSTKSSKYNADEESSSESLNPPNDLTKFCSYLQDRGDNVCFDCHNVQVPFRLRNRNQRGTISDHGFGRHYNKYAKHGHVKSFLCPCLKNFKYRQRESQNKPEGKIKCNWSAEQMKMDSKQVQTEFLPLKESKIIQTDKTKVTKSKVEKNEGKCPCDTKWMGSNVIHCDTSNAIFNPETGQSYTMCFPNPSLVCHYPHTSQLLVHHLDHKTNCKKGKRRNCEADKALQCNLLPTRVREEDDFPMQTKPNEPLYIKNYSTRPERDSCYCKPTFESIDYSKYLMEKRVREFLQDKESPVERKVDFHSKSFRMGGNFKRFEEERPNENETDACKPVYHHKLHSMEKNYDIASFVPKGEDRFYKVEHYDLNSKFNSNAQNSTKAGGEIENSKKYSPIKIKFLKQIESNESKTYGLVGHCKSSCYKHKKIQERKLNKKG